MKTYLNILLLLLTVAGLLSVVLGVFLLKSQYLIAFGCLLVAVGTGIGYAVRNKDHFR